MGGFRSVGLAIFLYVEGIYQELRMISRELMKPSKPAVDVTCKDLSFALTL